jgi:dihydrofolate reductase
MTVSIIVAMTADRVIGRDNGLPWRLPADLRRFKRLTLGHHLVVGRKTWESIGRPLPGRTMVVITRRRDYRAEGATVAHSVDDALAVARAAGDDEIFVGGGAEIYRETLERADRLYLTLVHTTVDGDAFFPEHDLERWTEVGREERAADARNPLAVSFITYEASPPSGTD